jgi:hypothetical protein
VLTILTSVHSLVRSDEIEKMVGDSSALSHGRFGGADISSSVDLHRVYVHDLAVKIMGEGNTESCFS